MPRVDNTMPVSSQSAIACDHGYHLYSALSKTLTVVHSENGIAIHPIRGRQIGDRLMQLMPWSRLQIRTPQDRIGELVSLAGQQIRIGDRPLRLGVPSVRALIPSTAIRSRMVTIKGFMDPETLAEAVRRQLDALEIGEQAIFTVGKRRTIRIRNKEVVGFEVILEGLTAQESIAIQEAGIGGRRHLGCGVFASMK